MTSWTIAEKIYIYSRDTSTIIICSNIAFASFACHHHHIALINISITGAPREQRRVHQSIILIIKTNQNNTSIKQNLTWYYNHSSVAATRSRSMLCVSKNSILFIKIKLMTSQLGSRKFLKEKKGIMHQMLYTHLFSMWYSPPNINSSNNNNKLANNNITHLHIFYTCVHRLESDKINIIYCRDCR